MCLRLGINCAFTAEIEFGTSTLNGYHVTSGNRFRQLLPSERILNDLHSHNSKLKPYNVPNFKGILSEIIRSDHFDNNARDCRVLLYCAAICVYLNEASAYPYLDHHLDLLRVVLLHAVLLTEVPLTYRALPMDDNDIDKNPGLRSYFLKCFINIQY